MASDDRVIGDIVSDVSGANYSRMVETESGIIEVTYAISHIESRVVTQRITEEESSDTRDSFC